jgi:hypothetical protein
MIATMAARQRRSIELLRAAPAAKRSIPSMLSVVPCQALPLINALLIIDAGAGSVVDFNQLTPWK